MTIRRAWMDVPRHRGVRHIDLRVRLPPVPETGNDPMSHKRYTCIVIRAFVKVTHVHVAAAVLPWCS